MSGIVAEVILDKQDDTKEEIFNIRSISRKVLIASIGIMGAIVARILGNLNDPNFTAFINLITIVAFLIFGISVMFFIKKSLEYDKLREKETIHLKELYEKRAKEAIEQTASSYHNLMTQQSAEFTEHIETQRELCQDTVNALVTQMNHTIEKYVKERTSTDRLLKILRHELKFSIPKTKEFKRWEKMINRSDNYE